MEQFYLNKNFRFLLLVLVIFQAINASGQKKASKISFSGVQHMRSDKNIRNGAKRLIGTVKFRQDSTIMDCDSAYFYSKENMFEAFGNVHVYKIGNESIDIKSDFLRHDGDKKMAYFRNNVVLKDTKVTLKTDSLDYDISRDIGYYIYGGTIIDSATTLTSQKGHYYHHQQEVFFKTDVEVIHNEGEYQMYTDTIKYNTNSKLAYFFGPTEFFNDTNYMFAEFGWYNTDNDKAFFKDNALYTNPKQSIVADSLFYDRDSNSGKAYSNVVVTDTIQNLIVKGNYLELEQEQEWFFVTDSAQLMSVMGDDTVYIHADTLYSKVDTSGEYRSFIAYKHVKIFKSNFQAKTDSLSFSMRDSIVQFHGEPVLWAEGSQITSEYIEAFIVNEKLDRFKLYGSGLIVMNYDDIHFNQIKGREVTGYLRNNSIYRIDVKKKSETIYFPEDEQGILGVNKATSEDMTIYMKKNKPHRIIYRDEPDSDTYPLPDLQEKEMKVKGFMWLENLRPLKATDIFIWDGNSSKVVYDLDEY